MDPRGCIGSVYRVTADFLAQRGLIEDVKAKLPPESRAMLEKPPFPFAWRDARALEDIEKVLHAQSPQLAEDLGYAAAQFLTGTIVAPVFKMALSLFGQTPASLFGNLDRFFPMVVRGFSFRYEAGGDKDGTVFVQISGGRAHESLFRQLRGNLHVAYELCGTQGSIDAPAILRNDDLGAEVSFAVRWT